MIMTIPTILGLIILTFTLAHLIPTEPAIIWAGGPDVATPEIIEYYTERYHLNESIPTQFYYYFLRLLHGDLGVSPYTHEPVINDITRYYPRTIELTLVAMVISTTMGVVLGIVSALKRESLTDHIVRVIAMGGVSMPSFWLALLMQFVFYYYLGWFPAGGISGIAITRITGFFLLDSLLQLNMPVFFDYLWHITLPATTLALVQVGLVARIIRSSMLEIMGQDYITTARSKGLPEKLVIWKHALRNLMVPLLTIIGLQIAWNLSGAVLVETVFSWPGMGRYAVMGAIRNIDYPAIMGIVLLTGLIMITVNFLVDVGYTLLDPRIELGD